MHHPGRAGRCMHAPFWLAGAVRACAALAGQGGACARRFGRPGRCVRAGPSIPVHRTPEVVLSPRARWTTARSVAAPVSDGAIRSIVIVVIIILI
eukprot:1561103-Lingulodinium_polyedra.AAC.1